jgi:hypothetical protein
MAQINDTKKPPQFDGSNYPYWKAKMTIYIKSINRKVWKVVETKFEVADPKKPTAAEEVLLQNNDIALSVIHDALDQRTFEQITNIEVAHDAWKKLEESFEGTQVMKGAKAYILKEKFASFRIKEYESVPEMFHRLQVLVNDLKALEKNEGQGLVPDVLEKLNIEIWHIGHYSSKEWFGHYDTKPSVGRCDDQ